MKGTADFQDAIANACLPEAAGIVDHAAALDAAVDGLNAPAAARDAPIRRFLRPREMPSSRLPGRHADFSLFKRARQEAQILEQAAACGQGIRRGIRHPFIVRAAGIGLTHKEDRECGVDEQHVFHRGAFFLAALTARLLSRILGALEAPFGPIGPTRGEASAGAAPGRSDVVGDRSPAATSASATPMRLASAITDRVGVSPSARSVACSTTNRT